MALAWAALLACGGSTKQDVLEGTSSSSSGTSGTGTSSGTSGGTSSGTSGTGTSSGTSGTGTSGGTSSGKTDASTVCPDETEPNDSKDQANPFTTAMCGALSPDTDTDVITFKTSPTTSNLRIDYTGKVVVTVSVNNKIVVLAPGVPVPVDKNSQYFVTIKAQSRDSKPIPWRVDVTES